jgi:hypothetical protein
MIKIMLISPKIGICLTILCLGIGSGCHNPANVRKSRLPSELCIDHLPCRPTICDPCFGYHPTCWMPWPGCCGQCPPPEQMVPMSGGPETAPSPNQDLRSPAVDLEVVPVPQEEPEQKSKEISKPINERLELKEPPKMEEPDGKNGKTEEPEQKSVEPPKAEEPAKALDSTPKTEEPAKEKEPSPELEKPLPKAKDTPKAQQWRSRQKRATEEESFSKAEPPSTVVPIEPTLDDYGNDASDTPDWENAPWPKLNVKKANLAENAAEIIPIPGYGLTIPDSNRLARKKDASPEMLSVVLGPEIRSYFPKVCQVVYEQKQTRGDKDQ